MASEIQITNRSAQPGHKLTADLKASDGTETILQFVLGPGEAVILPLEPGMHLAFVETVPEAALTPPGHDGGR